MANRVSALFREHSVKREVLYRWRAQYRAGGKASDLTEARRRIAELERKVGQQQLDLDLFKGASQLRGSYGDGVGAVHTITLIKLRRPND